LQLFDIGSGPAGLILIIGRYVTAEIAKPMLVGLGLLVVVFTGYGTAVKLTQAAEGLIHLSVVAALIGLNTIIALEVLLPTALYLSIIGALSRFYRDSEMAAMNAAGISESRLMRSVFVLSLIVAIIVSVISLYGRPWAYRQSYQLEAEAQAEFDINKIEPGQFIELQDSKYVLFARAVNQQKGRLSEVFLQSERGEKIHVIYAQEAYLPPVRFGEPRTFNFFDGYSYLLDSLGSNDITLQFKELLVHLPDEQKDTGYRRKAEPTINLFRSEAPKDVAEFQWRVSTPFITICLALLAVPLSRSAPRVGRYRSFFVAILVYVALFNLISIARNWVEDGKVASFPGIWWVYAFPLLILAILMGAPLWARRKR
jgi:lipopolysaccharide export system permease protein